MDKISIFQFIGSILDSLLNPSVDGTPGKVISTFTAFFVAGCAIYLSLLGYAIAFASLSSKRKKCFCRLRVGAA